MTSVPDIAPGGAFNLLLELQKRTDYPLMATIELNRRCNLRCRHCFLDLDNEPGQPTETLTGWIEELSELGVLFLTFTGGEITLRPDWLKLVRIARKHQFAVRLKTNGTRLDADAAQELASLSVFSVDISFYGARAQTHDSVTGTAGSWERTITAVRHLHQEGIRVTAAIMVTSVNATEIRQTVELARELGCYIVADPVICDSLDTQREVAELRPSQMAMNETVDVIEEHGFARAEYRPDYSVTSNPWPCIKSPGGLYIRADGELRRCAMLPISFGNIRNDKIAIVWRDSQARKALCETTEKAPVECEHCGISWACSRCVARALAEHGDMSRPAALDCQLALARSRGVVVPNERRCTNSVCGRADLQGLTD